MALRNDKGWPNKALPLLPRSLREAWSTERLPAWVQTDLHLLADATFAALGPGIELGQTSLRWRVRNFLIDTVITRRDAIASIRVFTSPWPPALAPSALPLGTRPRNCLASSGLLNDRAALERVTFGHLLSIKNMGAVSVLDFSCCTEGKIAEIETVGQRGPELERRGPKSEQPGEPTDTRALLDAIDKPWSSQISAADPRFGDLLPAGPGTILERIDALTRELRSDRDAEWKLAEGVAQVAMRVAELSSLPLDRAVEGFVAALTRLQGPRLQALIARLGWGGSPPVTLDKAAAIMGITRERLRQIQKRCVERIPTHSVFMPSLDEANRLVSSRAPLDLGEAARVVREAGLSTIDFHPESLLLVAAACHRPPLFEIETIRDRSRVVSASYGDVADTIVAIAYRQASASGVTNSQEVAAETASRGIAADENVVREVLGLFSTAQFLEGDWFWNPGGSPSWNFLRNTSRKMLSVTALIPLNTMREGLRRQYRFRGSKTLGSKWPVTVPPRSVLKAFYVAHQEFAVDETDNVSHAGPLDYRQELSPNEQTLVDVLRSSPACVLDRETFLKSCSARGMNPNTFSIYSSYSSVIDHLGMDLWSLRGVRVDPAAVESIRSLSSSRERSRRVIDHGWTPEGHLWVAVRLPYAVESFVMGIPGVIRRYVAGRKFPAFDENQRACGSIRVSEEGTSHGYGPFLRRRGADEGDILVAEFDVAAGRVALRLGDEDLLGEMAAPAEHATVADDA